MRRSKRIIAGALASALAAPAAMATDLTPAPVVATPVVVAPAPAFSWNRTYVGVYGGWWNCCGLMAGVNAGHNMQLGSRIVIGADFMFGFYDPSAIALEAYALARAGFLLGERVLVFGAFGAGFDLSPFTVVPAAAAGVEVGVGDAMSIRGQVLLYDAFNSPDIAGVIGFAWHFGGP